MSTAPRNGEKEIIRLRYRLPNGKLVVLGVTEEHPFMLEGKRWVNAGALKPGDRILRLKEGVLTVVSMRHQTIKQHTYNFEVEDFHTYFAGVGGAWVHNSGGPCDLLLSNSRSLGRAGESAVKAAGYEIGEKMAIQVNGRGRIPDGINEMMKTLSEVKNVNYQSFSRQLRDYLQYANDKGFRFDLFTRPGTKLSQPLQDAVDAGLINHIKDAIK